MESNYIHFSDRKIGDQCYIRADIQPIPNIIIGIMFLKNDVCRYCLSSVRGERWFYDYEVCTDIPEQNYPVT